MMPPFIKIKTGVVGVLGIAFVGIAVLIGTIIIASCIRMYNISCEFEERSEERILRQDSIRMVFYERLDSVMIANSDSLRRSGTNFNDTYALIMARLKHIEGNQENIISDCRQETNNIINKINGWIGFWIAILAIFGGLIPIIIQYVLNHKTKLEYDCILNEIQNQSVNNQMQLYVSTLWVEKTCSVLGNSVKGGNLISLMTVETIASLKTLLECIETREPTISERNKIHVINSMVQCYRLLDILKMRKSERQTRRLNQLQNDVRKIIEDLLDLKHHRGDVIMSHIHDLISNLYGINNSGL